MKHLLFAIILANTIYSEDLPQDSGETVGEKKINQELFTINAFGAHANYTAMTKLVNAYKDQPNAETVFLELTYNSDVHNRLYGLYGLRIINSKSFDVAYKEIIKDKSKLLYSPGGCVIRYMASVQAIADEIAKFDPKILDP